MKGRQKCPSLNTIMTEDKYINEVIKLRSRMVAVATRYLENHDEAEDITQDALLKLWFMHEMIREEEVDRLAFTILKHLCINELKKREYRKQDQRVGIDTIDLPLEADNPHEVEEREQQLMKAVSKLPSKQRMLLQMRYINGKDIGTIAQLTGSSEDSIHKALSRARNNIYKYMAAVVVAVICAGVFTFLWQKPAEEQIVANLPVATDTLHKAPAKTNTLALPPAEEPVKMAVAQKPAARKPVAKPVDKAPAKAENPLPPPIEDENPAPPDNDIAPNEMLYMAILEQKLLEEELIQQAIYEELFTQIAQLSNTPELSI